MLHSTAEWRFMCDADLSMPAEHIDRFLPDDQAPGHDIGIGSREAAGAQRFNEPLWRHITGRLFNYVARLFALGGLNDTQCGFKLYRGSLADKVFDLQTAENWGFDVEVLYLSRKMGASIVEVPIDWHFSAESKMGFLSGGLAFLDILTVRWNDIRGRYRDVNRGRQK
jgi:dolichyl-phosphate beta-glucosyltransferase